jgi:DNA-binding IclR family transcriptional regulator
MADFVRTVPLSRRLPLEHYQRALAVLRQHGPLDVPTIAAWTRLSPVQTMRALTVLVEHRLAVPIAGRFTLGPRA